ncbi:MAG TPA: DNA N-6-adenine-methyltransferase [Oculatellaceae cyanobacterium]
MPVKLTVHLYTASCQMAFISWREYSGKKGISYRCHLRHSYLEGGVKKERARYLGCIAQTPSNPERELFWMQITDNLKKLALSLPEREKIELAIAQKVPKGKACYEKFTSSKSDEHYTPPNILQAVYECLDELDLDPCSNSHSEPNVRAKKHFTIEDDGLAQEWLGSVFMNPPFSDIKRWVPHLISEYSSGRVTEAIALTKADTRTNWYKKLREACQAICFVEGYHKYGKAQTSATFGTLLTYFGNNPERFCEVFEPFGICKNLSSL